MRVVDMDRHPLGGDEGKQRGLHRLKQPGGELVEVRIVLEEGGAQEAHAAEDVQVLVNLGKVSGLGEERREGGKDGRDGGCECAKVGMMIVSGCLQILNCDDDGLADNTTEGE